MVIHMRRLIVMGIGFLMISMTQADIKKDDIRIAVFHGRYTLFSDSMFYTLPLEHINQDLMKFVVQETYGKTPEEIIAGLAYFYEHTAEPLLTAAHDLARHKDYLDAAIDVTQCMLDILPAYSAQATEMQQWLDDLDILCTCVEYVLLILKDNPQLVALILKGGDDMQMLA